MREVWPILHQLHRFGIPMNLRPAFVAKVAEQRRSGRAVAKHSIFHDGLAGANGGKEIPEVIVAVAVSLGRYIFLISQLRRSRGMRAWIFLPVLLRMRFCIASVKVPIMKPGSFSSGVRLTMTVLPAISIVPSEPVKISPSLSSPPSTKFTRRLRLKPSRIVEEAQHHVGHIPAVFPEAQPSGGHRACGPMRAGDEVGSAKEMDEKIAGYPASISLPLAPLEKVLGVKGNLGRGAQKSRPVTGFGRGIQRHSVVPGALWTSCDPIARSPY